MPGAVVPWPPRMILISGASRRMVMAMARAFSKLGTMKLMPMWVYFPLLTSAWNFSKVGKSSTVVGTLRFSAIRYRPKLGWLKR